MESFDPEFFSRSLLILRKKRGLTQGELAEKIGESRGKIGHYETGNNLPPLPVLLKLANALEVSIDVLVSGEESSYYSHTQDIVNAVSDDQEKYYAGVEQKNEVLEQQVKDLRREINTLRAYTARLEKDLERYEKGEQSDQNQHKQAG